MTEGCAARSRLSMGALLAIAVALAPGGQAAAQTDAALTQAAQAIEAAALARHVGVLTADSLADRATPSRGLQLAAQYVADQFEHLGLVPYDPATGQPGTSWFQRYLVPGHLRLNAATELRFVLRLGTKNAPNTIPVDERAEEVVPEYRLSFADNAVRPADTVVRWRPSKAPEGVLFLGDWSMRFPYEPPTVLVAGRPTAAALRGADLHDKVVLHVPAAGADSAAQQQLIDTLKTLAFGLVILQEEDSARFARRPIAARLVDSYVSDSGPSLGWSVYVRPAAIGDLLEHVEVDVPTLRAATTPVIRPLPILGLIQLLPAVDTLQTPTTMAMNTVGLLPGTDLTAADQYVLFSAHLDRGAADTHDNALGVAGLLELARAFSRPGARPRRTLVFLATSGGAQTDLWGSTVYAASEVASRYKLNLTLDRLGGTAGDARGDTVTVDGLEDVELGPSSPAWVAAAHPELGLTVQDGGPVATPSSDHFPFVKKAIPSLYIHRGLPGVGPGAAETIAPVDAEYAARVLRLMLYISAGVASAPSVPRWTTVGRQRLPTTR